MNEQHTVPNEKYNAKVNEVAEILHNKYWEADGGSIPEFDLCQADPELFNQARAMVAEMAKVYEHAYFSNYPGDEDSEDYALWNQNCISEMVERGLIPHPENNNNG